MGRWGLVLVCAFGGLGACYHSGSGFSTDPFNNRERAERHAAQNLVPLDLERPRGGPLVNRTFTVRAWVDEDYRLKPRWRAQVQDLVARVSAFTSPAFGASFEVEIRTWERRGDEPMEAMLEALEEHDDGADVDWVVGFVTAPQALSTDHHLIGLAQPMGKHFVLRDMNDAEEARTLDAFFDKLESSERAELYNARKRHKLLTTFLHEWAHTLGHPHEAEPMNVMSQAESNRSSRWSEAGTALLRTGVAWRAGQPQALAHMRDLLVRHAAIWQRLERQQAIAMIDAGQVASLPAATAGPVAGAQPAAPTGAERTPAPTVRLPDAAAVAKLVPMPAATPAAAPAAPATVRDSVRRAYERYEQGDVTGARSDLDSARARLVPGGTDWKNALQIYLAIGALTRAGELLAAHDDAESRRGLDRLRHDTGLGDPARSGVSAEDEPEVFAAFVAAIGKVSGDDLEAAEAKRRELARRFPRTLPVLVLTCAVEAGAHGKAATARKACAAALARWDDLLYAHFWAAQVAPSPKERVAHLKRAIELDPQQEASWQALAAAYQQTHDRSAEATLRRDFRVQFGRALP